MQQRLLFYQQNEIILIATTSWFKQVINTREWIWYCEQFLMNATGITQAVEASIKDATNLKELV